MLSWSMLMLHCNDVFRHHHCSDTMLEQTFNHRGEWTIKTIFQDLVDDFGNKIDLVTDLEKEVKTLSHTENVSLNIENAGLKNQLKNEENMFQTAMVEQSMRVIVMGNTMEIFF
jgi:hypothetical protein